eukprot:GHRQ01002620.1.p1 GENE.GHRQ01002620.1~~GHRQ01002620.1.p1  ORF type:complete len:106 (+),score=2.50 GHRQ01002620.1:745-1062(+)
MHCLFPAGNRMCTNSACCSNATSLASCFNHSGQGSTMPSVGHVTADGAAILCSLVHKLLNEAHACLGREGDGINVTAQVAIIMMHHVPLDEALCLPITLQDFKHL